MEFVIVTLRGQNRAVFVDQQNQGVTGVRLSVPEGLHVFDLGIPLNYTPPFQEVDVRDTTPTEPMSIAFLPALAEARRPGPRKAKAGAKRKKAKRPAKRARRAAKQKSRKSTRARKKK
jgi:hypothetical protein